MAPEIKEKSKTLKEELISEFCASSSIHGVRYLDSAERTTCERFWWIIVFFLSIAGGGSMIYEAYKKWDQNPIIVTFAEKTTPIWEVQFPAFTICPTTKVSAEKLNFTEEIRLLSNQSGLNSTYNPYIVGQLKAVAQVCPFWEYNPSLTELNGTGENDVVNMLKNLSLARDSVVSHCGYAGYDCKPYMKEIVTESGLCYSFNMLPEDQIFRTDALHRNHAYMEEWITNEETEFEEYHIPLNALGAGKISKLSMFLQTRKSDPDYKCSKHKQGYTITLHESSEYPTEYKRSFYVSFDHKVQIYVKPQIMTTSQSAAGYHWSKRQCFFENERHLQFFKIYNQNNCEIECLANITLTLCGCVLFSMPRTPGTEVCSLEMLGCTNYAVRIMSNTTKLFFNPFFQSDRPNTEEGDFISTCNCIPACSSVQYDVEVTQSPIDWEKAHEDDPHNFSYPDSFNNIFTLYFKDTQFITTQRSELYGIVDFLANCGGFLGLFMGFSILSLLEICYFITIRPFSLRRRSKKESRLADKKEDNNDMKSIKNLQHAVANTVQNNSLDEKK
ncbi:AGAP010967-PA-like protein [Anopheles sinensis]|uniref:AGAP010967-PA-like protein n=1 Tax=Anopheles sinensis TaxID=74873 RepID=A0A084WQC5_ANOSI|nr:AGAP010967-PA-like protein [Anopheles sinensis]